MANNITVKFKKLHENAVIPTYAHNGDVGMDMTAVSVEYDKEYDMYIYHTGLAFESDFNYGQFLFPRSSNRKTDAYLCNHVGIADSAIYRGEILFCFKNRTSLEDRIEKELHFTFMDSMVIASYLTNDFKKVIKAVNANLERRRKELENDKDYAMQFAPYKVGDKIGQMVFLEYPTVTLEEAEELSDSERGANGFGSTGN